MLSKKEVQGQAEEKAHDCSMEDTLKLIRVSVHDHFQDLTAAEEEWIDDSCLWRYFRASKQDQSNCITRLINTLKWRREYRPDQIKEEEVVDEAQSGKEFLKGFDRTGRPILYLIPARENSKNYDRMLKFVVFNLEKAVKLMRGMNSESLVIIVDYKNVSVLNAPPISVSKRFLEIIGEHYPERLGISFIMNPTWYLWIFFKLLRPFLDPVTASKINLVDPNANPKKESKDVDASTEGMGSVSAGDIFHYISPDQLLEEYGGDMAWKWNFESYWEEISLIR